MLNEGYQRHNFIPVSTLISNSGYYEIISMLKVVTNEKGEAVGDVLTIIC